MKWIILSIVVVIALVAIRALFFRSPKRQHGGSDDDGASNEHGTGGDGSDGGDAGGGD